MDYSTDDALAILYRCGIQTVPTLLKYLQRGGFKACERTIKTKLDKLNKSEVLEDARKSNKREPYLTEPRLKKLKKAHHNNPLSLAPELAQKAKFSCTSRTICRGLQKLGLHYMRIKTIPLITEEQKAARLHFAHTHEKDRLWRRTFFLDESTFQAYLGKNFCYQNKDQRVTKPQPKHPPKIHAIAMISSQGPTRIILFQENMKATDFIGYLEYLLEDARKMFPKENFRIYWDNDPKHRSKIVNEYIRLNKLNVPNDWPSSSPDMNPMENVWGRLSIELRKFMPKTVGDLNKRIKDIWKQFVTKEYCQHLVGSMESRMNDVISREGSKIDY